MYFSSLFPLSVNSTCAQPGLQAKKPQRHAWCLHYFTSPFQDESGYVLAWRAKCFMIWPLPLSTKFSWHHIPFTYRDTYHCSALEEQTSPNVFLIFTLSSLTHTSLCCTLISISKIQLKQSWTRQNSHGSKSGRPSFVLNLIFSLIIFNGSLCPFWDIIRLWSPWQYFILDFLIPC